jgi:ATP-dependent DNA helicase RecQ
MGIVEDWTITDFFDNGGFVVDFHNYDDKSIKASVLRTINKYDKEFNLDVMINNPNYNTYNRIFSNPSAKYSETDKYIFLLLQWSYDNFVYNRIQSLKNIYENSCDYADGKINGDEFKKRLEDYFRFNETSFVLQHITEFTDDYKQWFEVFYKLEKGKRTKELLSLDEVQSLKDNLSRFLESYMHNTGLDLISGLIRLLLDEYDNTDGKSRFESALQQICQYPVDKINDILQGILIIGNEMNDENKYNLAESLHKFFNTKEHLDMMNKSLKDYYTTTAILNDITTQLININKRIAHGFRQIR